LLDRNWNAGNPEPGILKNGTEHLVLPWSINDHLASISIILKIAVENRKRTPMNANTKISLETWSWDSFSRNTLSNPNGGGSDFYNSLPMKRPVAYFLAEIIFLR